MKAIITGGGTAGHINPALSIADMLKEKVNCEVLYIGTKEGLENELVDKSKYKMKHVNIKGIKRKISFENLTVPFILIYSILQSMLIIKKFKPDIVIGTGGYVSSPVVIAGVLMRKNVFLHEQNSYPGIVNRYMGRYVNKVFYSFKGSEKFFKKNGIFTGNPLDKRLMEYDKKILIENNKIDNRPVLIVTTGSRGSKKINEYITKYIKEKYLDDYNLIFVTGKRDYMNIKKQLDTSKFKRLRVIEYMTNRWYYYPVADLALTRAGALTLSEFEKLNVPMIIIPYPYATNNHQLHNALDIEKTKGALVLRESELSYNKLIETIESLIYNKKEIEQMKKNLSKIKKRDAIEIIYDSIKDVLKNVDE